MNQERALETMARLKNLPFGATRLQGEHGGKKFALLLLTADKGADMELIKLLAAWREVANEWFSSIFKVTVEGTARWYQNQLINALDRLLFIIETEAGYVGHVGLFRFDFSDGSCEIDNIVRGEKAVPGVMEGAIRLMMDWGRRELGIRGYRLQTFSNNTKATRLYEKLGFVETRREPRVKVISADRTEWVEAPADHGPIERYNVWMQLKEVDD